MLVTTWYDSLTSEPMWSEAVAVPEIQAWIDQYAVKIEAAREQLMSLDDPALRNPSILRESEALRLNP